MRYELGDYVGTMAVIVDLALVTIGVGMYVGMSRLDGRMRSSREHKTRPG